MSIEARQIQETLYSYAAILNFTPSPQGLRAKFGACSVQNAQLLYRSESLAIISRRIVSHISLRMLNFLASVMREFYKEIDRKNRIFGRKTDILRKFVAGCAILLNIYGKKD